MRPASKAFAAAVPTDDSSDGAAGDSRRCRNIAAACLLLLSVLIQFGGPVVSMNLDERFIHIWFPFACWAPPIASIASLILGDRRKLWVKLNYLVLGCWVLLFALVVLFFELIGGPG